MVTDSRFALPIDHSLWINKEFTDSYATKTELAKMLIKSTIGTIKIKCVILDGLYATAELMDWLNQNGITFEMRFHSNRMITIGGNRVN